MANVTSDKEPPSALQFLGDFKHALELKRRQSTNAQKPLKDLLRKSVAEYNAMTTIRRHRIDGAKQGLIYNMSLDLDQCYNCVPA